VIENLERMMPGLLGDIIEEAMREGKK